MLITLLTDFGTADYFVGAMKGVILSINPEAVVVDITHEVAPQDVREGAFTLSAAYVSFPAGTIHVAVVDPGVGSARRGILVAGGGQYFVGPDNGLFSFIYERSSDARVFQLTNKKYFGPKVSATFHGRDIFAPVAAALSRGEAVEEFGEEIKDYVRLPDLKPRRTGDRTIEATIIHIDRFGNCVTNLTPAELGAEIPATGARLTINDREITSFRRFFAEGEGGPGELFAIWGSAGYLEIAANRASAALLLKAERGHKIVVMSDE
ncbi:MAG TPA: SAM-dependent chlorinase/fluorinase [Pyrinomonadaceae bacterium]|nr:SAM-dependent chlorinase/fluorinase [Pyrinomonadaceae bacterium]